MPSSFWTQALSLLPPYVQRRHGSAFEAAERLERAFDITWNTGRLILAFACRLSAIALGAISHCLDAGARRLLLSR